MTVERRRRLPQVGSAHVLALLALSISIGGVSWAAVTLPRNSVGSEQLKTGAVASVDLRANAATSSKVKNGSLLAADFKAGELPAGERGPAGAQGAQGAPGIQGPRGTAGADGPQGPAGPQGLTGANGQDGARGPTGAAGPAGGTDPFARVVQVKGGLSDAANGDALRNAVNPLVGHPAGECYTVVLDADVFELAGGISLPDCVSLVGQGTTTTRLVNSSTSGAAVILRGAELRDLTIDAAATDHAIGVSVLGAARPSKISDTVVLAARTGAAVGGFVNGIVISGAGPTIANTQVYANGIATTSSGILVDTTSNTVNVQLQDTVLSAKNSRAGGNAIGLEFAGNSQGLVQISSSDIEHGGTGTKSGGVYNAGTGYHYTSVLGSRIRLTSGAGEPLVNDGSDAEVRITASMITPADTVIGGLSCANTSNEGALELTGQCQLP